MISINQIYTSQNLLVLHTIMYLIFTLFNLLFFYRRRRMMLWTSARKGLTNPPKTVPILPKLPAFFIRHNFFVLFSAFILLLFITTTAIIIIIIIIFKQFTNVQEHVFVTVYSLFFSFKKQPKEIRALDYIWNGSENISCIIFIV